MIGKNEINTRAKAEGLRFDQIEKDHVILWILHALSQSELKPQGWIFKGGTCLRHCYYSGYRFSQDLDFSCSEESGRMEEALRILQRVTEWVQTNSLLHVSSKEVLSSKGDFQVEIPLEYSRGGPRPRDLYDLWFILCHKNETFEWETLFGLFAEKCRVKKIEPDPDLLVSETLKSTNERVWKSQLEMLMKKAPDFDEVWKDWFTFCKERFGG